MDSQRQTIYYFCDPKTNEFFFYERYNDAKKKRDESGLILQWKTLKKYYGTIYLCTKDKAYSIHDHYGPAKNNLQYGYKIKKIVLSKFKEQFEDSEERNEHTDKRTVLW